MRANAVIIPSTAPTVDHMPATLDENMDVYAELRDELEARHLGEWVLIYDKQLIGTYPNFMETSQIAANRYGNGPYHIKRIGEPPLQLPPAVMFGVTHEVS